MAMKFRLTTLAAAICAIASGSASYAAMNAQPEILTDTRTIVIENGVVVENSSTSSPDILIAQANPGNVTREVRIIKSGEDVNVHNLLDVDRIVSTAMSDAFAGAAHGLSYKTVKNAPYSAEVITEKTQKLPDGNQISKRTSALTFRDGAGRTRQETRDGKGEVKSIHINDSVDSTRYILSPASQSATRIPNLRNKVSIGRGDAKRHLEINEKMNVDAKDGSVSVIESDGQGREIIIKKIHAPATDGKLREDVKVHVTRLSGDVKISMSDSGALHSAADLETIQSLPLAEAFARPTMMGNLFEDAKWSSKSTTTQLGSKEIEGLRADGKSVSYTIPTDAIGNKNPITVTTETWYSPDLQATVYSKSSDPRVGETIYRLANLRRGEQPASLFAVPAGYTVKETPMTSGSSKSK
jgi:hypothetical protein